LVLEPYQRAQSARDDVQRLLTAYCDLLDSGRIEEWALCYTPDGIFEGPSGKVAGREALVAYGSRAKERGFYLHYLSNVQVDLDDSDSTKATAKSYLLYVQRSTSGELSVVGGSQSDVLRRGPDGWKIAHRTLTAQPLLRMPGAVS
jgi:3-phenylpropionate/cinnamic acid dioxygenase small subunit